MKRHGPGQAAFSAFLALILATLACAGGTTAPTAAPTRAAATVAPPTAAVATSGATAEVSATPAATATGGAATAAATASVAPTEAAQATDTEAATTAAPTEAPAATATKVLSGKMDVGQLTSYVDSLKYYRLVGLVTNGTDKPVDNIVLAVQLADASGKTVLKDDSGNPTSTVTINTMLGALGSGESSPFEFYMDSGGADTSGWKPKITVASSDALDTLDRATIGVENNLTTTDSAGDVWLTGELVNHSDQPAQINDLAGAAAPDANTIAAASTASAVSRLLAPAGDKFGLDRTPFEIKLVGPIPSGAAAQFYIDAVLAQPDTLQSTDGLKLKLETAYVTSSDHVSVIATISNSGTETVTSRAVAGLYDAQGRVLDAAYEDTTFDIPPGAASQAIVYYFGSVNGNSDLIGKVVSYTAQIDPYWTFSVSHGVVSLKATKVTTETNGSTVTIKGTIVNTTKQTLDNPQVIVLARDASGKIVAGDWTGASGSSTFAAGAQTTFSLDLDLPKDADASQLTYDVQVQSQVNQ
jgi:hypothetical protein